MNSCEKMSWFLNFFLKFLKAHDRIRSTFLKYITSLLVGLVINSQAEDENLQSRWDKNLLSIKLSNVHIDTNNFLGSWHEIGEKYLVRANLFYDEQAINDNTYFYFNKQEATARELLDAYITTYPEFTYTQDNETGVLWIHPKRIKYNDILDQNINILTGAKNLPMYSGVYRPLCDLLAPRLLDSNDPSVPFFGSRRIDPDTKRPLISQIWFYDVDLPAGIHSVKNLLNYCCVANPTTAFAIGPMLDQPATQVIYLNSLIYGNPIAQPRDAAIKYWEDTRGKPAIEAPSAIEVGTALCDLDPRMRHSACLYFESCLINYDGYEMIKDKEAIDQKVWIVLGWEYVQLGALATNGFHIAMAHIPNFKNDLDKIQNAGLALLVSLELARENMDGGNVDAIIGRHKYTYNEINSILPELTRMARTSKAVRDKLLRMNLPIGDLIQPDISKLEDANYLTKVPGN